MMFCSKQAPHNLQAAHYTTLATAEVLGKLLFVSLTSGWLVELFGYTMVHLGYVMISVLTMRWFRDVPVAVGHMDKSN